MFCPYCGSFNTDESTACCRCGGRFPEKPIQPNIQEKNHPAPEAPKKAAAKKGRLWPPLLALAIMFAMGLGLFFAIRLDSSAVTDPAEPWFSVRDGVLYFDETLYVGGEELTVPSSILDQTVSAISDDCFAGCSRLTTVNLPEGILSIGNRAFKDCVSIRGMMLPETLLSIGSDAFAGCTALEAVCIPYATQKLGTGIFRDCENLLHVFYPAPMEDWNKLGIDSIGKNTHVYCVDGVVNGG